MFHPIIDRFIVPSSTVLCVPKKVLVVKLKEGVIPKGL